MVSRRDRSQLRSLERALDEARSYQEWLDVAHQLDATTGASDWRDDDESDLYDAASLYEGMLAMRRHRAEGDLQGMAGHLTEHLYRHLNDLLAPELYEVALGGTKRVVERYLEEAEQSVRWLAAAPGVPREAVRHRFEDAWHVFGRTALLLSGGATWGFHHLGVVKALFEQDLLPEILSGASTGAMVAAGVAARSDAELADLFAHPEQLRLDGLRPAGLRAAAREGAWLVPDQLQAVLDHNIGRPTFAEAHAHSGRTVAISVSPTRHRQKARLLTPLTAPDVLLTSAVMASSALPGLFPPVELMRRRADGTEESYVPGERWVDGSIAGDLPKRRLSRLHNVNHFVVSQVNPHVLPFVRSHRQRHLGARMMGVMATAARSQGLFATDLVRRLTDRSAPMGRIAAAANAVFRQEYRGHVDLNPRFRWRALPKIVSNPSLQDLSGFIVEGERAVWPRVAMIREQTRIGRAFRDCVAQLHASESPAVGA